MNALTYYWLSFTVLTGIWETTYLLNQMMLLKYLQILLKIKKTWNKVEISI